MAPVLQCPDCGERHPLDAVHDSSFRCRGCGRLLKVPAQFRPPEPAPPPRETLLPGRPVVERAPVADLPLAPLPDEAPPAGRLLRFLVWLVGFPLGFVLVFFFARSLGFLSQRELEDLFLETSWSRFGPVLRLLPFCALVIAAIVHFSLYGIGRWRESRARRRAGLLPVRSARSAARGSAARRRPARAAAAGASDQPGTERAARTGS